jgi:hypothetical protein
MKEVFRQNKRVETVALVNRVLVVSLKLVEGNDLKFEKSHAKFKGAGLKISMKIVVGQV